MKFVHMADMHFDMSFSQINDSNLGTLRRVEQRNVFKKIIDFISENQIEYFFIAGDLYEHKFIKESTIDFINSQFKKIPNTRIFITPGNHDPYINNSYYNKYNWNDNVKIFTDKLEKIELPDFDLYGFGFDDFYMKSSKIEDIVIENRDRVNILITHGSLDGGYDDGREYNPMPSYKVKQLGFDYVALGHIHKRNLTSDNYRIVYPGSTVAQGFDEPGSHGIIVGEFNEKNLNVEYVPMDESEFVVLDVDISGLKSIDDLVMKLQELSLNYNNYYEIYLVGNRSFEIDMYNLKKMIISPRIIKIKDKSIIGYDIESLINNNTLKGLFVSEIVNRIQYADENEKIKLEKALEIGLEILDK